jgi:hypothetical protein
MLFRVQLIIVDQSVSRAETFDVRYPAALPTTVSIWQGPHPRESEMEIVAVEARCETEIPKRWRDAFALLAKGVTVSEAKISDRGDAPATDFEAFCRNISDPLNAAARHVVETLRWLDRAESSHNPYAGLATEFSLDGHLWWPLPQRGYASARIIQGLHLTADMAMRVQTLVAAGDREPLAHQLAREARDVSSRNPRSAIVIGLAAGETGFKGLVGDLVPGAAWLVEKVQSPPLVKMLKEYLPQLPLRRTINGSALPPPRYIRQLLTSAIEERNRIVHVAVAPNRWHSRRNLDEFLDGIVDLLYLLDYYAGHDWAINEVSQEFRNQLGT